MAATLKEVKEILLEEFPGAAVDKIIEERHRITGILEWEQFADKTARERNQMISNKLRDKLGDRGMNVGMIVPMAPGETFAFH